MATLASPTSDELLQNVRNMLNQPSSTNSFWSDEELLEYMNEGVRRFFQQIVTADEGQFVTTADLDLVAGTETVALPSDCFKVCTVYRLVSDGYVALPYRQSFNTGFSSTNSASGDMYQPVYYLRGNSLVLRPLPAANETAGLRVEYVQFPDTMITGGDSMTAQLSPIFKDLVQSYAVWKAKIKESLVNGANTAELAKDNLNDLVSMFNEVLAKRSQYPTYIQAWNPEE